MENGKMLPQLCGVILEDQADFSLADISRACAVHLECIIELVEEGVLVPRGREPHRWLFNGVQMRRASVALRLQRDLGLNLAGAALALQLLDEVNELRTRLGVMSGH